MRWNSFIVSLSLLFLGSDYLPAQPAPAAKKLLLSLDDLYHLAGPRSPVLAPNGQYVAYSRYWIDRASKRERYSLWLAEDAHDKTRALEADELDARRPVVSPDGKWIAFFSTRPRPAGWRQTPPAAAAADPVADIWLIATAGGQAAPLAGPDKPYGRVFHDAFYGRIAFSADSRRLAFIADDGKPARTPEEEAADFFRVKADGGEGYTGWGPGQVWVAELEEKPGRCAARRIDRLTDDDIWYGDPQWAPDGKSLVVVANRTADREAVRFSINKNYDLWALDIATRGLRQLTAGPGPDVSPRFSPDGRQIAFLTVPRKGSHRDVFNLAVVTLDPAGPRSRVLFDHHSPDAARPLHPAPTYPLPDFTWDGDGHLIYFSENGVTTGTLRIDIQTGQAEPLNPKHAPQPGQRPMTTAERLLRLASLVPAEDPQLKDRHLAVPRVVRWDNGEGQKLEGILTLPPSGVAAPPFKLLLNPHGGPHGRSALGFDFAVQLFAAQGYAVFQPNFRGSQGYGQKFVDADRADFGGGDVRDIRTGIDHLLQQGLVDRDRQFVFGSSYGGFLTTWLVGHTNQFRAAVAQNAVTDLGLMWSLSDIPSWIEWEFGGPPFAKSALLRQHSPLTYVANVKTPTLIVHSRDDRRVPLPLGQAFHRGLEARGVPTEMIIFPDEGHVIREPRHREEVLRRILAWFARYDRKAPP